MPEHPAHVRPMLQADLEIVAALSVQLGYPIDPSDLSTRFEAMNEADGHQGLVICENAEVLV